MADKTKIEGHTVHIRLAITVTHGCKKKLKAKIEGYTLHYILIGTSYMNSDKTLPISYFQILDLSLGPGSFIEVRDSNSFTGALLAKYESGIQKPPFVMSVSSSIAIYVHTVRKYDGGRYKFSYCQGM